MSYTKSNSELLMKYSLFIMVCLLSFPLVAQIDNSQSSTNIPAVAAEENTSNNSSFPNKTIENNGLSNPDTNRINGLSVPNSNTINSKNSEFSMFGENFGNPGELYNKQVQKHVRYTEKEKETEIYGKTTDQYLGDFKTKVSKVNIVYRDFQYPDGDRIRIFVNDDVVRPNVLLSQSYGGFHLNLVEGFNKIDFLALNQGESGPNTAEFQVLDEEGNVISSNQWNLATGVKATIIIIKEKTP